MNFIALLSVSILGITGRHW